MSPQSLPTGGEEEAEAAYDEAFHAIFQLQLERHRHTQPYTSKKDGRSKWAMIEMSPITVSSYTTTPQAPSHRQLLTMLHVHHNPTACHDDVELQYYHHSCRTIVCLGVMCLEGYVFAGAMQVRQGGW